MNKITLDIALKSLRKREANLSQQFSGFTSPKFGEEGPKDYRQILSKLGAVENGVDAATKLLSGNYPEVYTFYYPGHSSNSTHGLLDEEEYLSRLIYALSV